MTRNELHRELILFADKNYSLSVPCAVIEFCRKENIPCSLTVSALTAAMRERMTWNQRLNDALDFVFAFEAAYQQLNKDKEPIRTNYTPPFIVCG